MILGFFVTVFIVERTVYSFVTQSTVIITLEKEDLSNAIYRQQFAEGFKINGFFPDCEKIFNVSGKDIIGL